MQKSPVKIYAESQNLPVFQPQKIRLEPDLLRNLRPDYCVTAAFGQILSEEILRIPKATINVHASLLPKHRGAAPVQWAILQGDSMTGVTTMLTDKGIDTGDMLLKAECPIEKDETSETLLAKLSHLGANLLLKTLAEFPNIKPEKQNETEASYDPMPKKTMGEIDFTQSAEQIERQIRAFRSYFTIEEGLAFRVSAARVLESQSKTPATVVLADPKKGLHISTGTKDIEILKIQAPSKKEMDAKAYLLGNKVQENCHYKAAF